MSTKAPPRRIVSDAKEAARDRLNAAIAAAAERGRFVPCFLDPDAWYPINRRESDYAVDACQGCPVLAECSQFADTSPVEVWGVWAGEWREGRRHNTKPRCEACDQPYDRRNSQQRYCSDCASMTRRAQQAAYDQKRSYVKGKP